MKPFLFFYNSSFLGYILGFYQYCSVFFLNDFSWWVTPFLKKNIIEKTVDWLREAVGNWSLKAHHRPMQYRVQLTVPVGSRSLKIH
jgi:hypothetical protein